MAVSNSCVAVSQISPCRSTYNYRSQSHAHVAVPSVAVFQLLCVLECRSVSTSLVVHPLYVALALQCAQCRQAGRNISASCVAHLTESRKILSIREAKLDHPTKHWRPAHLTYHSALHLTFPSILSATVHAVAVRGVTMHCSPPIRFNQPTYPPWLYDVYHVVA